MYVTKSAEEQLMPKVSGGEVLLWILKKVWIFKVFQILEFHVRDFGQNIFNQPPIDEYLEYFKYFTIKNNTGPNNLLQTSFHIWV